jgi:hypothetical protein
MYVNDKLTGLVVVMKLYGVTVGGKTLYTPSAVGSKLRMVSNVG